MNLLQPLEAETVKGSGLRHRQHWMFIAPFRDMYPPLRQSSDSPQSMTHSLSAATPDILYLARQLAELPSSPLLQPSFLPSTAPPQSTAPPLSYLAENQH